MVLYRPRGKVELLWRVSRLIVPYLLVLELCSFGFCAGAELSHDVIIVRDPPFVDGALYYAQIGSLRLAQKLGKQVGDTIEMSKDAGEVLRAVVEAVGGSGRIFFRRGNYAVGEVVLPLPCSFIFEGEQRRCATARLFGSIRFAGVSTEHCFVLMKNLSFASCRPTDLESLAERERRSRHAQNEAREKVGLPSVHKERTIEHGREKIYGLDLRGVRHFVLEGIYTVGGTTTSHIICGEQDGMKLLEHPVWLSGGKGICWNLRARFVTVLNPECFNAPIGIKFGAGGLYVAGHLGVGTPRLVGISTYPLSNENERCSYATTVLSGAPEGPGTAYEADGASMVLVGCHLVGKRNESSGGKLIIIGNR